MLKNWLELVSQQTGRHAFLKTQKKYATRLQPWGDNS
jgi:hypothetical protein